MELLNLDDLQRFIGAAVEIIIRDEKGSDQAPVVKKTVNKVQFCPDHTHIRFYFDHLNFLAVPLASQVNQTETSFSADDPESGLSYIIKKVQVF